MERAVKRPILEKRIAREKQRNRKDVKKDDDLYGGIQDEGNER